MHFADFRELETERLVMRRLGMDDLYDYYEYIASDGQVTRFMLFQPHQDIGETMESIQRSLDGYEAGRYYRWAVALKESDTLIGIFELLNFDEAQDSCGFAYMFARHAWGKGYATETLKEALRFAFEEMGVRRVSADHMAGNDASGAVMRKAGMIHVGTQVGKYEKWGQRMDAEVYEIVKAQEDKLTVNEYQRQAMKTLNPRLSKAEVLLNGVMGLCGEAGESIDVVKKHLHQGHDLDRDKLIRELGDVAWYLAETAYALDVNLEDVFQGNLDKLKARYPQGFETDRSINR